MQFDGIRQDVIGGIRGLRRTPGVAVAALVTLALGIGATSALFTVVKAVLLTPLPYAQAETRVMLWSRWISFDKTWLSDQEILDYRRLATTLTAVAGWTTSQQNLTGDGEPERITVGLVTANTFAVLGAAPLLGRAIAPAEDVPNAAPVAVLGYGLWQTRYGGDPGVVGRRLQLDDQPVEIVGVMPEGFRLPTDFTEDAPDPTQIWRALQLDEANAQRGSHGYYGAAVLAPGATVASASTELGALTAAMTEQGLYPPAMRFSAFATSLDDEVRGAVRPAMWLLSSAVACLLLIACANVANLLLVRGDARLREMAVRSAIGATTERLVRQLLTESILLAIVGAALGLGLAAVGVRALLALDPTSLPPLTPVRLDGTVVVFTFALAVVTTLVFGLVPALRTLRINLVESLREGSQQATASGSRQRLRGALVVAEVTLAVVLVIGAGLMVRSLGALGRVPLGFNPDRVLTMRVSLPASRYDSPEKVVDFYRRVLDDTRALSGVSAAGVVRALPLATTIGDYGLDIDGFEETPGRNAKGDWQIVSDGAFEAMGARLLGGRWFGPADTTASQPVMVVNETMARTYWPDGRALGGQVRVGGDMKRPKAVVVGIVADERHNGVTAAAKEKFFVPHSQWHVADKRQPHPQRVHRRAHQRRPAGRRRSGARGVAADRPDPAGVGRPNDGRGRGHRAGDASPHRLPARCVCRHRAGAGGGGPLRRALVRGRAPHARDRHPPGDGRAAAPRAHDGAAPGADAGVGRHRARAGGVARGRAPHGWIALRRAAHRPADLHRRAAHAADGGRARQPAAGPAGRARQPDAGAAHGVSCNGVCHGHSPAAASCRGE